MQSSQTKQLINGHFRPITCINTEKRHEYLSPNILNDGYTNIHSPTHVLLPPLIKKTNAAMATPYIRINTFF